MSKNTRLQINIVFYLIDVDQLNLRIIICCLVLMLSSFFIIMRTLVPGVWHLLLRIHKTVIYWGIWTILTHIIAAWLGFLGVHCIAGRLSLRVRLLGLSPIIVILENFNGSSYKTFQLGSSNIIPMLEAINDLTESDQVILLVILFMLFTSKRFVTVEAIGFMVKKWKVILKGKIMTLAKPAWN